MAASETEPMPNPNDEAGADGPAKAAATPGTAGFLVLANRLPVRRVTGAEGTSWETSPGGLVTALAPLMTKRDDAMWLGWSGTTGTNEEHPLEVDDISLVPVPLSRGEVELFYEGFANRTLWPLYHDSIVRSEYHRTWWDAYRSVNRRFAKAAAKWAAPGAAVWVHDYHLQLVPGMLRELRPDLTIGFFLHIPFPPVELFLQIPWRRTITEGLLGADVVGFQTEGGASNFRRLAELVTDSTVTGEDVCYVDGDGGERTVQVRCFGIGVDTTTLEEMAAAPEMVERAQRLRESLGNPERVLLGVDRLDYTKGLARRLRAFRELLEEGRLVVGRHVFVQVAEPTRENVRDYADFRDRIDRMVGEINGDYGEVGAVPMHYLHRHHDLEELVALYLAADVMLVTAVRDGMNLVCKEYVATRRDLTGALVLSEFAGAAETMGDALMVNPYDIDGLKLAIEQAVTMPVAEQHRRMELLRRAVVASDVHRWADQWLDALGVAR
ncbi:MAG: trehalose-6-phosphate synthase [Microthrixaceae bacterium]